MDGAVLGPVVRFVLRLVVRFMLDPVVRPALVLVLVLVLVPRGGTRDSSGLAGLHSASEERDDDHQREEDRKDPVHDLWVMSGVLRG